MNKIRIFVADDHPIVREGLVTVLETQDDFEVVGQASDGKELLETLPALNPEILFIDLAMPKMDGLETIKQIKKLKISVGIIVFTVFDTDERIVGAIKSGAKGYLLKGASRDEIFNAVRVVHRGGSLLQPEVASRLFAHISNDTQRLTPRELDVLKLMSKGLKNSEIAETLFISERTVKFHVSSILGKLDAQNRTEAVQLGIKKGLVDLE